MQNPLKQKTFTRQEVITHMVKIERHEDSVVIFEDGGEKERYGGFSQAELDRMFDEIVNKYSGGETWTEC